MRPSFQFKTVVLAAIALSSPALAAKLAIVPFAALSPSVPDRAGAKAAHLLATELKGDELTVLESKKGQVALVVEPLARARKAMDEAAALRNKRKFRLAEEALQKAIAEFKTGASGLSDFGELADAYALLSAVLYNTGRDEDGNKALQQALKLNPARDLPLQKTSPLFSEVVEKTRKQINAGPRGTLTLESVPPGASAFVDGLPLGATPVMAKDIPAGNHYWSITLPWGEVINGWAEVAAKPGKVMAQSQAKDAEAKLMVAISQNKLDDGALSALKEHAQATGSEQVVFGTLSKEGKDVAMDAYLFNAQGSEVRRLPRAVFPGGVMGAGMEVLQVANQLKDHKAKAGEAVKVPTALSKTVVPPPSLRDVKFGSGDSSASGLDFDADAESAPTTRSPATPKRAPLKKK